MKTRSKPPGQSAKGSVAVEMAIMLPLLILILALGLFFARIYMFYSVGQKAAHDATRFLSTVTQAEMRTPAGGFGEARVAALARWIAQEELMDIVGFTDGIMIHISCDLRACGQDIPKTVTVQVQIILHDDILDSLTSVYLGNTDVAVVGDVTMRYVGR